jgi:hypothetical protein
MMAFSTVLGDLRLPPTIGLAGSLPQFPALPTGYDVVAQCSNRLLNYALNFNLAQDGLDILSARVPYDPAQVSPGLRGLIANQLRHAGLLAGVELEVVLLDPSVGNLYVPAPPPSEATPGGGIARRASSSRSARPGQPSAELTWTLQVNLFQARPVATGAVVSAGSPGPGAAGNQVRGVLGMQPVNVGPAEGATNSSPGGALPQGSRTTLAQGTAVMQGKMNVGVLLDLLRFWMQLDLGGSAPTYNSAQPVLTEFLATSLAAGMLAQAVAPLVQGYDARISPTIAVAGNLGAARIASLDLGNPNVAPQVTTDSKGQVLTFCANFGRSLPPGFIGSFLNGRDFACYVTERVFGPILIQRWNANAIRVPITATVPVEMQVSEGSAQTGQGTAQVQLNISDVLKQSSIQPSDLSLGDPLQLVSEQTVQLLHLWDPSGNEVTQLGSLADPSTKPLVMNLQLFDPLPPGAQQNVNPLVQSFIAALLSPIYRPITEDLGADNVGGFTSSSLHALVVTWNVPKVVVTAPVATTVNTAMGA